jgi:hypothetical protein
MSPSGGFFELKREITMADKTKSTVSQDDIDNALDVDQVEEGEHLEGNQVEGGVSL